ncbi:MAG: hypothetical protein MJE66_16130 [Proteobacteria bacterium]|nr:hypothetical protein [Pseudomonadota bacterium]
MKSNAVFEAVCGELEARTSLDRLEARGTVRLALKGAGLEPGSVTADQMAVVLERVLPGELSQRGIDQADAVCAALRTALPSAPADEAGDSPEAVFARLGGEA